MASLPGHQSHGEVDRCEEHKKPAREQPLSTREGVERERCRCLECKRPLEAGEPVWWVRRSSGSWRAGVVGAPKLSRLLACDADEQRGCVRALCRGDCGAINRDLRAVQPSIAPRFCCSGSLVNAIVGGLSGVALNAQVRSSPTPRRVAVPVAAILKRCSSVPLGACVTSLTVVTPPPPATSRWSLPVARTTRVLPAGTVTGSPAASAARAVSPGWIPARMIGGLPV